MDMHLAGLIQHFATPWTVAHQAPPSLGFSRQERWSGLRIRAKSLREGEGRELETPLTQWFLAIFHSRTPLRVSGFPVPLLNAYPCICLPFPKSQAPWIRGPLFHLVWTYIPVSGLLRCPATELISWIVTICLAPTCSEAILLMDDSALYSSTLSGTLS